MIQLALLPAKKLLQELCANGIGWDDPIKCEDNEWWEEYFEVARIPEQR